MAFIKNIIELLILKTTGFRRYEAHVSNEDTSIEVVIWSKSKGAAEKKLWHHYGQNMGPLYEYKIKD